MQSESAGKSSRVMFLQTQLGISGSDASKYLKTNDLLIIYAKFQQSMKVDYI